jgi:hypothetical protein
MAKKKLRWMQTPEGKKKLSRIHRARWALKRNAPTPVVNSSNGVQKKYRGRLILMKDTITLKRVEFNSMGELFDILSSTDGVLEELTVTKTS